MGAVKEATILCVQTQTGVIARGTIYAVSAAIFIGTLLVGGVGLAGSEMLHNAAHDLRHGLAFPCH